MADELVEVHVWTAEDGSVTAVGRALTTDRRVKPMPGEGQSVTTARVRPELLESPRAFKLNRDSGELEAAD
jgi:hypothetical protein